MITIKLNGCMTFRLQPFYLLFISGRLILLFACF